QLIPHCLLQVAIYWIDLALENSPVPRRRLLGTDISRESNETKPPTLPLLQLPLLRPPLWQPPLWQPPEHPAELRTPLAASRSIRQPPPHSGRSGHSQH